MSKMVPRFLTYIISLYPASLQNKHLRQGFLASAVILSVEDTLLSSLVDTGKLNSNII